MSDQQQPTLADADPADWQPVDTVRESPDRKLDHIDVLFDSDDGRRVLRYTLTLDDVAHFQYEVFYDDIEPFDVEDELIRAGAAYIEAEFGLETVVLGGEGDGE